MIEFYIEDNEVILPDDFTFTWVENNPEINNEGDFTLDITVSLDCPENIKAFKFLNRLNLTTVKKTVDAKFIIDRKLLSGSAINAKNTNKSVTLQFVAGNSELNYIAKNEKKIYSLDWGSTEIIGFTEAKKSLQYPDGYGLYDGFQNNYVCAPVTLGDIIANDYSIDLLTIDDKIIMQPYLLYYINKLPELLGYKMGMNILNSDLRARKMYIVNAIESLNYSDALPDMTITEFIDSIETFFNVSFIVDSQSKTLSITRMNDTLAAKKRVVVNKVFDDYIRDFSEESKTNRFGYTKIKYGVSSSDYFKYHSLSDEVLEKCKIVEVPSFTFTPDPTLEDKLIIYRDVTTRYDQFLRHQYNDGVTDVPKIWLNTWGIGTTSISLVNKFAFYGDSDDSVLTLTLCPSALTLKSVNISAGTGTTTTSWQMPQSSNSYATPSDVTFIELVEDGEPNISRISILEVSLYSGLLPIPKSYTQTGQVTLTDYPISQNDSTPEAYFLYSTANLSPQTLRLVGPGSVVDDYKIEKILDVSQEYVFVFPDGPDINANNIFIINNSNYMPISFEREKSRTQKVVKGTFYRMI